MVLTLRAIYISCQYYQTNELLKDGTDCVGWFLCCTADVYVPTYVSGTVPAVTVFNTVVIVKTFALPAELLATMLTL